MGRFKLKAKHSRRAGVPLTDKHAKILQKRNYPPGQHGPSQGGRRRLSGYGVQLLEKQKARWSYGLREGQLRKYFEKSVKHQGDTGEYLLKSLELRLDNVVYRMGFAKSRAHARQLVNHGHFLVNGKRMDIPSYTAKKNDVITIKDSSKDIGPFKDLQKSLSSAQVMDWFAIDPKTGKGTIIAEPTKDSVTPVFDLTLVVEFYSR